MIKEALQYLVGLKENKTYDIDGRTYSDNVLTLIEAPRYYPDEVEVGSLDSIVKLIRSEYGDIGADPKLPAPPLFVRVVSPKRVSVFSRPDDHARRIYAYRAVCTDTDFSEGWREQQSAIIELRSRFLPTDDTAYLLDLISRINSEEGIRSDDNGVSQTVTARKGVSLAQTEMVRPRVSLRPFRTFREVPQPESEFILRLDDNGRIGLFEADGGIWKMEAKDNIRQYLEKELTYEIDAGKVIVMV